MQHGNWLWESVTEIARHTDRQIIVRPKPTAHSKKRSLEADLLNAWCVVTYSSNIAVEALIMGIPVVTLGPCVASNLSTPLEAIESPHYPDNREEWAQRIASNQWTLDEIRSGECWDAIN